MERVTVLFLPDNLTVKAKRGSTLLDCARLAGIELASTCGGEGTCGRCLVKIKAGRVKEAGSRIVPHAKRTTGHVLACRSLVEDDIVVEIPQGSRLGEHRVLLGEYAGQDAAEAELYSFRPLCRKVNLALMPPALTSDKADLDRFIHGLKEETGCGDIRVSLEILRELPLILRQDDFRVTVYLAAYEDFCEVVRVEPGFADNRKNYGLAVDIGTTTVALCLLDLETGMTLEKQGTYNKQSRYGDDVITRIVHAETKKEGLEELRATVMTTINGLIEEALLKAGAESKDVHAVVVAGNTTMCHLFLGITPRYIRLEPYTPAVSAFPLIKAAKLGLKISPEAPVYTFPAPASYVGGDIVAGILATGLAKTEKLTLFIDIGTNGELVLGNKDWLLSCACSAGPAFEGGGISSGMRAVAGAVEQVTIDPGTLEVKVKTIGGRKPAGICGSGLISCLAEMRRAGIIDRSGRFNEDRPSSRLRRGEDEWEFVLVRAKEAADNKDILISESDLKNLLRAKAAVYAGIRSLLKAAQLEEDLIEQVYIAGGFGNYLNITDAVRIGLLPDLPPAKFMFTGNTSLKGARVALLAAEALEEARRINKLMTVIELSDKNEFMEEFMSALFLPHTDLSLFPSVET
ncbi:MAG TPA: DUF4445 domain-containing protein [Firmicutes bacterium]|nr:DUF4445 domain-containing protein [Bacillota bacterium]